MTVCFASTCQHYPLTTRLDKKDHSGTPSVFFFLFKYCGHIPDAELLPFGTTHVSDILGWICSENVAATDDMHLLKNVTSLQGFSSYSY